MALIVEFICEPQGTSVDYNITSSKPQMIDIQCCKCNFRKFPMPVNV